MQNFEGRPRGSIEFRVVEARSGQPGAAFAEDAFAAWQQDRGSVEGLMRAIEICDHEVSRPGNDEAGVVRALVEKATYIGWLASLGLDSAMSPHDVFQAFDQQRRCLQDAGAMTSRGMEQQRIILLMAWGDYRRSRYCDALADRASLVNDSTEEYCRSLAIDARDSARMLAFDTPKSYVAGRHRYDFATSAEWDRARTYDASRVSLLAMLAEHDLPMDGIRDWAINTG